MNYFLVQHLVRKDWYLNRRMMVASLVASALTFVAIAAARGSNISIIFGVIVLATILIGMGAVIMSTIVMERKQQTLPFVMSLPISYSEYTTSKVLGSLLLFLVLWTAMLAGTILTILNAPGFSHGLVPFVIIMMLEILVSTCLITTVAVTTESQGWTIGVTQVGGLALNAVGYYVAHIASIRAGMSDHAIHWSKSATILVLAEFAIISLMLGTTFFIQSRKRDFV